jgi:hypothetical protein
MVNQPDHQCGRRCHDRPKSGAWSQRPNSVRARISRPISSAKASFSWSLSSVPQAGSRPWWLSKAPIAASSTSIAEPHQAVPLPLTAATRACGRCTTALAGGDMSEVKRKRRGRPSCPMLSAEPPVRVISTFGDS